MAEAKARATPRLLRRSAALAYERRWTGLLAIAGQTVVAASLLEDPWLGHDVFGGELPSLGALLHEGYMYDPPDISRMGGRWFSVSLCIFRWMRLP